VYSRALVDGLQHLLQNNLQASLIYNNAIASFWRFLETGKRPIALSIIGHGRVKSCSPADVSSIAEM
jgi:hypothetical protein